MNQGIALPYIISISCTTQHKSTQHVDQRPVEVTSMIPMMLATLPLLYCPAMLLTFLSVTLSLPCAPGLQISSKETPHRPGTAVTTEIWRRKRNCPTPQDTNTTRETHSFPPKRQRRKTWEYVTRQVTRLGQKAGHPSPPLRRLSRRGPLHHRRRRSALALAPT